MINLPIRGDPPMAFYKFVKNYTKITFFLFQFRNNLGTTSKVLDHSDMRIPCNKNDQRGGATGTEEVWVRDEMVRGEVDRNRYTHNRSLRSG
jgi:hypothetical protein